MKYRVSQIHGIDVTSNNFINNNVVFFFRFRFENSIWQQLLILDYNALGKRGKIFCVTAYLETKSFKTVSKEIQSINIMIYCRDKKLKKRLHVLEADIIPIKKTLIYITSSKDKSFSRKCSKWLPLLLPQ